MSEKLEPCPFCGKEGGAVTDTGGTEFYIVCQDESCKAMGPSSFSAAAAIAIWNRRVPPPPDRGMVEALDMLSKRAVVVAGGPSSRDWTVEQMTFWRQGIFDALNRVADMAKDALSTASQPQPERGNQLTFQNRVRPWMLECFGPVIPFDKTERNHRFLEEALELVQSIGCTQSEAHQLVDYVFGRPLGEPHQEVGGVMVTLAALCVANNMDMDLEGETELARIWTKVEQIRAKQAAKPKHSPLPQHVPPSQPERLSVVDGHLLTEADNG